MPTFEQLRSKLEPLFETDYPYKNDLLVHDKNFIEAHPDTKFLHWFEQATVLMPLWSDKELPAEGVHVKYLFSVADRDHIASQPLEIANRFADPISWRKASGEPIVHYFDGHKLRRIDIHEAVHIAKVYYNVIHNLRRQYA